ncbi:hypothetical protein HHI36_022028 [Cryptolaemus montrouzieri]|uniref:Tudor domain-containing protein 7 n=1 Tax=Cryptolaemus montrouzieri TaxID=559131 RepID=A0ABD2MYN5_9CUCU
MERMREEVIANIRACLISFKGKVSIRQLENDYRTLLGEKIPYSKLGYKSVEDFISTLPSLTVTRSPNGEWFVDAKTSEKSNHITDMVNKQKTGKRRAPPKAVRFHHFSKAPQTRNWSPANINYKPRKFKTSERTSAVSHNQLVSRSPVKMQQPNVKSKVVIPEHSTYSKKGAMAKNADTIPAMDSTSVNGTLNNTPLRRSYSSSNQSNITETPASSTRLRTSNCQEPNEPVDLTSLESTLLHTSKKRITRMMSEVSMDRDSGNSSPTHDTKDSPTVDILLTDNPIADLKSIVKVYKLGEVEVIHKPIIPKKKNAPILYNCKITVDGQTYLSYPNDFFDEKSAQEYCSRKALEVLVPKCSRKKSLLLSTSKDIKDRIPPMLQTHFQGVWSWQIEADYVDKYMEQLPLNWLEIIDSCDCVAVERIQDKHVLRYCRPGTKGHDFVPRAPLKISIPSNTVKFGEDNRLFAQITCIMSLNEVWLRQWDTPEFKEFNEMTLLMEPYYNEEGQNHKVENIQLGSFYVASYDSNWYRVRALEIQDNSVNCFLIDFGDEYLIDKNNLYDIRREFATSQAQAFVCRLAGLEDLYDANIPLEKLTSYVGNAVILESAQSDDTDDTVSDQSIPVVMYDFSNGNSLNEEILETLAMEIAMPTIKPNIIQEVFVSHLTDAGDIYVQVRSKGFESLQRLLENLENEIAHNPPTQCMKKIDRNTWMSNKDRLYLSKDKNDGHWYRAKILDMSPKGDMAQVYFVDKGNYEVVKISQEVMYPLDKISDVLHQFPAQAVQVRMVIETIPQNFAERASEMMSLNSPVLLKIVGNNEDNVPIGDFYKRSDDGLICINKSIVIETEMNSKRDEDSVLKGTRIKLVKLTQLKDEALKKENVPSGGLLKSPPLPNKGKYFEVHIPFAVNPWNFFVQPYASRDKLNEMMTALQKRYNNATYSPLQINMILPGQIYATKHSDGIWYRTSVLKVINSGSISVFYCDFGYYSSLCLNQLIPLEPEFVELPYQALKAKLSGIKPKKDKWSMEDCEIFTELVRGKSLVSVLIDIEKDELYESDPVLKLTLIDTSTDEDIFIDRELIQRNIAIIDG